MSRATLRLYERYKDALRRGHVAALRGRHDAALDAYGEAARDRARTAPCHTSGIAGVLRRLGRPADALAAYDAAPRARAARRGGTPRPGRPARHVGPPRRGGRDARPAGRRPRRRRPARRCHRRRPAGARARRVTRPPASRSASSPNGCRAESRADRGGRRGARRRRCACRPARRSRPTGDRGAGSAETPDATGDRPDAAETAPRPILSRARRRATAAARARSGHGGRRRWRPPSSDLRRDARSLALEAAAAPPRERRERCRHRRLLPRARGRPGRPGPPPRADRAVPRPWLAHDRRPTSSSCWRAWPTSTDDPSTRDRVCAIAAARLPDEPRLTTICA